jgi:hypothetical protein
MKKNFKLCKINLKIPENTREFYQYSTPVEKKFKKNLKK